MDNPHLSISTLPVNFPSQRRATVPAALDEVLRASFTAHYEEHMPGLIRFVMRYGATPYEAADACQAAYIEAFRVWHLIASPTAWFRKVALPGSTCGKRLARKRNSLTRCRSGRRSRALWRRWSSKMKRHACTRLWPGCR